MIVSTRIADFSVEAVLHDAMSEYALGGGPLHPDAAKIAGDMRGMVRDGDLGSWNDPESIRSDRPGVDFSDDRFYGTEEWKDVVRKALRVNFAAPRSPRVVTAAIASSDRLIKDPERLRVWLKLARQVQAIEMESAGVYKATHGRVPFLAIRGISDVVGLKRQEEWTSFACHSAAALAKALLEAEPRPPLTLRPTAATATVKPKPANVVVPINAVAELTDRVRTLFELNHFDAVNEGSLLRLKPSSDPFATPLFAKSVDEFVDDNFSAISSDLSALRAKDPSARLMLVSALGFSDTARQLSSTERIDAFSYAELFSRFERFDKYISHIIKDEKTKQLDTVYEEPDLHDLYGTHRATNFLTTWRDGVAGQKRWLVLVGEYGTGKTALTRVLQRRWLVDYKADTSRPIPFRIELRQFIKQFNARGLIHEFLDHNELGDVPIDFVFRLIRQGRVVLLLDGYDEMAQYLHARERRGCLEALADLSHEGARGLITSRPNYFSESEEFQLFEVLYKHLDVEGSPLSDATRDALVKEQQLDSLLTSHFLERYERSLRDLNQQQTEGLVRRQLQNDRAGQDAVLKVLNRVFRSAADGVSGQVSLSGKPVIISYLLDVVEGLKAYESEDEPLTEYQLYTLVVDMLMDRDFRATPQIVPRRRREFLRRLAVWLSKSDRITANEDELVTLVSDEFSEELRRIPPEQRNQATEQYVADMRRSATLTRMSSGPNPGWLFSHSSLREYFVSEWLVDSLLSGGLREVDLRISDPMRIFISSMSDGKIRELAAKLAGLWTKPELRYYAGILLALLWNGLLRLYGHTQDPIRQSLIAVAGTDLYFDNVFLDRIALSTETVADLHGANFREAVLYYVSFRHTNLSGVSFHGALLEGVDFSDSSLVDADLTKASLSEAVPVGADVRGAIVRELGTVSIIVEDGTTGQLSRLEDKAAIGYLAWKGAVTDPVAQLHIVRYHPRFPIADKILRKLGEQGSRQRHGITKKGISQQDPNFAEAFVDLLEANGYAESTHRTLVSATDAGRNMIGRYLESLELPDVIFSFLKST